MKTVNNYNWLLTSAYITAETDNHFCASACGVIGAYTATSADSWPDRLFCALMALAELRPVALGIERTLPKAVGQ